MAKKYWKFGTGYAGVTARGKRVFSKTLDGIRSKVGIKITKSRASKPKNTRKKRSYSMARKGKKRSGGGGKKVLGQFGVKGLLLGIGSLIGVKYLARKYLPVSQEYAEGIAMTGAGALGHVVGLPTKTMLPIGVMDVASEFVVDAFTSGGAITLPFVPQANSGGYDV